MRFMQQQRLDEQRSKWAMVLFSQPNESSSSVPESESEQPEPVPEASSAEPPPSVPTRNIVEEIMMKYGLKKTNHPPIVIAKPIPSSSGPTSATPPSEPISAPPTSAVKYSESRKKVVAKRRANKSTTSTETAESEQEIPSVQAEIIPETQPSSQEEHVIPILKEVKLEI